MSKQYSFPTNVNGISDDDGKTCDFLTDANCIGQSEKDEGSKKNSKTETASKQADNHVEIHRDENDRWETNPKEADTPIDPKTDSDKNR